MFMGGGAGGGGGGRVNLFCVCVVLGDWVSEKLSAFLATRSWLVRQKIAAILARPKQPCEVTGCVNFVPGQKSRVKIRDVAGGLSPRILCFRNLRAARKSRTVSLTNKLRIGSILWPFLFGLDIFTIFSSTQAKECAVPSC